MDSIFKISKINTYGILVEGLEKDNDEYLNEDTDVLISTRNYAYSHSVSINILMSVKSNGDETLESSKINQHCSTCVDSSEFTMTKDGLYKISHLIIPNKTWLNYLLANDPSAINNYTSVFYYDADLNKIFKYIDGISTEISISNLILENTLDTGIITSIIRSDKNTFIMYYLNDCFNKICKNLLSSLSTSCSNKSDIIKQQIFNRDLIWMGINTIKYSIETLNLYEAQRIYEDLTRCGSPCSSNNINTNINCGCNN